MNSKETNNNHQKEEITNEKVINSPIASLAKSVKTLYDLLRGFPLLRKEAWEKIQKLTDWESTPLETLSRFQLLRLYIFLLKEYKKAVQDIKAPVDVTRSQVKDLLNSGKRNIKACPKQLHLRRVSNSLKRKAKVKDDNEKVIVLDYLPQIKRSTNLLRNAKAESYRSLDTKKEYNGFIVQNSHTRNKSTLLQKTENKGSSFVSLLPDLGERQKRIRARYTAVFHKLKKRIAHRPRNDFRENMERWKEGPKQNTYFDEFLDLSISKIGFHNKCNPVNLSFS